MDRDRVLYSTAFLRLAEVTQVVSADRGYVFHNRLTHSLKVAQLARRIAESLHQRQPEIAKRLALDPDAAEAAALAHDLGHPPFGHIAEEELNTHARAAGLSDGFEGNAQSFRIVAKIAAGDALAKDGEALIRGLNLCRATLNGILKYPWRHDENAAKPKKWGAYESEREIFEWARARYNDRDPVAFQKSAEAELMDWADDITYAVHDLTDFYCAAKIPLDRLADRNDNEREGFYAEVFARCPDLRPRREYLQNAFAELLEYFPIRKRYDGTADQRCTLWQFNSVLISRYVKAITLSDDHGSPMLVTIDSNAQDEIAMLKQLTWHYVILNDELATEQHGQRQMIKQVLATLLGAVDSNMSLFPLAWREEIQAAGTAELKKRTVVDYVAGMTERELSRCYALLSGGKS